MFYGIVLATHSLVRWALLVGMVVLLARAFARGPYRAKLHATVVGLAHLQLLLGLLLYVVLSPVTRVFLDNAGAGMKVASTRFFGVEHGLGMLVGIALVQVSRTRAKRAEDDATKQRRTRTWLLLALVPIVVSVPWPFSRAAPRPWLRGISALDDESSPRPPRGDRGPSTSG